MFLFICQVGDAGYMVVLLLIIMLIFDHHEITELKCLRDSILNDYH